MAYRLNDILLPVETVARELDAKLLLALFAAEAGFRCHIGVMSRIQSPGFPPSIYVSKSVRFAKQVRLMRNFGHTIVAWDEEGLARFNDTVHSARIEPEAFRLPRLLFSWGKSNSDLWRRHPFYDGTPIADTGNPRIDLLRPELHGLYDAAVSDLRRRFGTFALFNSNFGIVNHFKAAGRKAKVGAQSHDAGAFIAFRRGVEAHKRRIFEAFLDAVPVMAQRFAPHHLVIRPHPSEDHAAWHRAAAGLNNVSVVYEGPVVPWQLAARCLVHNGCTSAVEAAVLRLPALAYRPVSDAEFDIALPNALSENFTDIHDLCARARQHLDGEDRRDGSSPYPPLLRDNIASLEGPLSCARIVAALDALRRAGGDLDQPLSRRLSAHGRHAYRRIKHLLARDSRRYEQHKSSAGEFTPDGIAARARPMAEALGRFGSLRFIPRAPGVVTIVNGA
jgi:surface carbohydrate biosynthesis protein